MILTCKQRNGSSWFKQQHLNGSSPSKTVNRTSTYICCIHRDAVSVQTNPVMQRMVVLWICRTCDAVSSVSVFKMMIQLFILIQ